MNKMVFSINDKKMLVSDIGELSKHEHIEIFKIIREYGIKYTQNDNGILLNMNILDDKVLERIYQFVTFCKDNKKSLEENEEILQSEKDKMLKSIKKEKIRQIKEKEKEEEEGKSKNEVEKEEEISEGASITLKRNKPKYGGIKAKIIKNYNKNNNSVMQKITYKNKEDNKAVEEIYDIGEETYDDLDDEFDEEEYVKDSDEEDDFSE